MSWIERLRERIFGFSHAEPEGMEELEAIRRRPSEPEPNPEPTQKTPQNTALEPEPIQQADNGVIKSFPSRVLFVCSGNMCRSRYGAARFKVLAQNRDVQVISAGTLRIQGRSAAEEMIKTAQENGLDLTSHRSSAISQVMVRASDVIFVMERIHRQEIMRICPDAEKKIVMLGQWLDEPKEELIDPMGKLPEIYRAVAHEIDQALENWFKQYA